LGKQIRFSRAAIEGADWYAGSCLAGEAGLRSGEVKALRWREDVDLTAKTITVNQQTCYGETTTPKGRTRRTIPMTSTLETSVAKVRGRARGLRGPQPRWQRQDRRPGERGDPPDLPPGRPTGEALAHLAAHVRHPMRRCSG
jgi:integrase